MMRASVSARILTLALFAGCVHTPKAPDLERALRLETKIDVQEMRRGQFIPATFILRNVTAEPLLTCLDGDGVSVKLRSPDGKYLFPLTSFSIYLHAMCPNETLFQPGETKTFRQSVFLLSNFPADRALFEASVQLKQHPRFPSGPGTTYFSIKSITEVRVTPEPPPSR